MIAFARRLVFCMLLLVAALVAYDLQPWRFVSAGYARGEIAVAGGTMRFFLVDHAGREPRAHCLSSVFETSDPAGEPIRMTLELGTRSRPGLRRFDVSGATRELLASTYFQAPDVGRLEFAFEEPLEVAGTLEYRGEKHPFRSTLQLKRWHRNLQVRSFCAGG